MNLADISQMTTPVTESVLSRTSEALSEVANASGVVLTQALGSKDKVPRQRIGVPGGRQLDTRRCSWRELFSWSGSALKVAPSSAGDAPWLELPCRHANAA
jgi:hypothetical protein